MLEDLPWLMSAPRDALQRGPSLATQAHRRLKMRFMLGEMEPGRRLTYREVAHDLGISVTPAREAVFKLIAERVLEAGPNGTIVVPENNEAHCQELWRIRLLLEPHAAEIATAHVTANLIRKLEQTHSQMAQAKQDRRLSQALRHNLMFHFLIYREARSPIMLALIEDIWARSASYVQFFHTHHVNQRDASAAQGPHMHSTIIAGLRDGDAGRVRSGIARDLTEVRDGILGLGLGVPNVELQSAVPSLETNIAEEGGVKKRRMRASRR